MNMSPPMMNMNGINTINTLNNVNGGFAPGLVGYTPHTQTGYPYALQYQPANMNAAVIQHQ